MTDFSDDTLSVIMRCHRPERLPFLEEAVFSLAVQGWADLELIVVIQNPTSDFEGAVAEVIEGQPWPAAPDYRVCSETFPAGFDGRSSLLNRGLREARGRFVAFLDDDDVVYHDGYEALIETLREVNAGDGPQVALAAGGCRLATTMRTAAGWYVKSKTTPFSGGRSRFDLIADNFVPIHSYVIDRAAVDPAELRFDDEIPPLEDYDLLLRLAARYEFDFSNLDRWVCEYRIHDSNSLPYGEQATEYQSTRHQRAIRLIEQRKAEMATAVPLDELRELVVAARLRPPEPEPQPEEAEPEDEPDLAGEQDERRLRAAVIARTDAVYDFFDRHPSLAGRLSRAVRRVGRH